MRGRALTVVMAAAVLAVTAVLISHDPPAAPSRQAAMSDPATGADPTVIEAGTAACPTPVGTGAPVPALSGATARCLGSVQHVNVAAVLRGSPTLLNLWASWCAPCRAEMPVLDAYTDTPDAVRVIGINLRDRPSSAAALVRDLNISYPSYTDAESVAAALHAPQLLPLSYVVGTDGSVRRLPMQVFGDVAAVTEAIATTPEER